MKARTVTLEVARPLSVSVSSLRVLDALESLGAHGRVQLAAQQVADQMGCSRTTARSRIEEAETRGFIHVRERVGGNGVDLPHEFRILDLGASVLDAAKEAGVIERLHEGARKKTDKDGETAR